MLRLCTSKAKTTLLLMPYPSYQLLVAVALSSDAAINVARSLYEYCPDDDDNGTTTINAVLPATYACPLLSAHALAETNIATTQAITAVLSISQDPELHSTIIGG
jgi:hypothetical protein